MILAAWLTGFLDILGGAYAACALFNIGIFMVGKLKKLTGTVILVATLLIVAKTYVYVDVKWYCTGLNYDRIGMEFLF